VFPVRYEHHLHIESKAITVNAVEVHRCVSCEVRTSFT
jgi:ribosomal protein L37AE/L43A